MNTVNYWRTWIEIIGRSGSTFTSQILNLYDQFKRIDNEFNIFLHIIYTFCLLVRKQDEIEKFTGKKFNLNFKEKLIKYNDQIVIAWSFCNI